MFIREVSKTIKGKKYIQHQLMESFRIEKGPRQKLILNLGTLDLPKEKHKELANRINIIINNKMTLIDIKASAEVEPLANHYAEQIIKQRLNNDKIESDKKEKNIQQVDLNTVTNSQARTIGAEHIVLEEIKQYKLNNILKNIGFTEQQITYALILIVGRLLFPSSERKTVNWANNMSGIKELLKTDLKIYDNALHRTAVKLWENHEEIESKLSKKAKEIFDLKETIILYDLTNTYFEGTKEKSNIVGYGKSKERRNDRPLITLALTVDGDGFAKKSNILPGNPSEPESLEDMLDKIEQDSYKTCFNYPKTIVIDAGIASEDNLEKIRNRGMKYVAVSRKKKYAENMWENSKEEELKLSDKKNTLKVKLVKTETEAFLLCESKAKEIKEKGIINRRMQGFEKEIKLINEKLKKKKTIKKYEYVLQKIGRLQERYKLGNYYKITIDQDKGIATKIKFEFTDTAAKRKQAAGKYVIRTNRLDLTAEEISKIHRSLTMIEQSFRSMKGELGLRPNYHQTDEPTKAHIYITVIAYHIVCSIIKKLQKKEINYTWKTIRDILATHVRITTTFNNENDEVIHIRNNTNPEAKQIELYNALKVKHKPLPMFKTKVKNNKLKDVVQKMKV